MNGNKKQPLVPRLRFPEFRGAVSVLPLDAVADFVSEKFSVDQLTPAQYVSTENLLPDFGGISPATKLPSVSSVTSFRHRDILVSNIRPYLKKVWQSDMCGGVSNDVLVIRPTERVGADYLAAILRSDFFINYVMRGAKGVKMPRGEISMIREFPVPNPCPEEQQKIADCLSSLDDLIAAETQKLDTLKTHKKGLMQQLFPREGETVPRLRFPEFREAVSALPLDAVAERGAKGVKMPRGEISMIREFLVPNPCPEEQQKIADCLSALDSQITTQAEKIDALKTHKKGLMQQLFPVLDEVSA